MESCFACERQILDDINQSTHVYVDGFHYHGHCFVCSRKGCRADLRVVEFAFGTNDRAYCNDHIHEAYVVSCAKCQFRLKFGDDFVEIGNKDYHPHCFRCEVCDCALISDEFVSFEDKIFCSRHAPQLDASCHRCKKACSGKHVKAMKTAFCYECFNCELCSDVFPETTTEIKILRGNPCCDECFEAVESVYNSDHGSLPESIHSTSSAIFCHKGSISKSSSFNNGDSNNNRGSSNDRDANAALTRTTSDISFKQNHSTSPNRSPIQSPSMSRSSSNSSLNRSNQPSNPMLPHSPIKKSPSANLTRKPSQSETLGQLNEKEKILAEKMMSLPLSDIKHILTQRGVTFDNHNTKTALITRLILTIRKKNLEESKATTSTGAPAAAGLPKKAVPQQQQRSLPTPNITTPPPRPIRRAQNDGINMGGIKGVGIIKSSGSMLLKERPIIPKKPLNTRTQVPIGESKPISNFHPKATTPPPYRTRTSNAALTVPLSRSVPAGLPTVPADDSSGSPLLDSFEFTEKASPRRSPSHNPTPRNKMSDRTDSVRRSQSQKQISATKESPPPIDYSIVIPRKKKSVHHTAHDMPSIDPDYEAEPEFGNFNVSSASATSINNSRSIEIEEPLPEPTFDPLNSFLDDILAGNM